MLDLVRLQRWGSVVCLSIVLMAFQAAPQGTSTEDLEAVKRAVVSIWGVWEREGQREALCIATGFLLNDQGVVITNDHVLRVLLEEADPPAQAIGIGLSDGSMRPAQIIARMSAPQLDLAILEIEPPVPAHVLLGNPQVLPEGEEDRIKVIGFPAAGHIGCSAKDLAITGGQLVNRNAQVPEGFSVSFSVPPQGTVEVEACAQERVLALQAGSGSPIAVPGSSGSPVVNESGQVVGILCGGEKVAAGDFEVVRAYAIPVDLALEKFSELSGRVPPHAPEIVDIEALAEVEEGQQAEITISFWDVNADLEAVILRPISPSDFSVPEEISVAHKVEDKRFGEFTISFEVGEVTTQDFSVEIEVRLQDRGEGYPAGEPQPSLPMTFKFQVIPLMVAVQRRIDEAPDCAVITIPAREKPYSLPSDPGYLKINRCITLKGAGPGETVIRGNKYKPVIYIRTSKERYDNVTIEGLTLEEGLNGILIKGKTQVTISNMNISNNGNGVVIQDIALVKISDTEISDNDIAGIRASVSGPIGINNNITLDNVKISNNDRIGITAKKSSYFELREVELQGNDYGIKLEESAKIDLMSGSMVLGNNQSGIVLQGNGEAVLYSDSSIKENGSHGVEVHENATLTIKRVATISGNKGDGLLLDGFVTADVQEAIITENEGHGVALFVKRCHPQAKAEEFEGEISGRENEIYDNAKGDLCPQDYDWPPGFIKPRES